MSTLTLPRYRQAPRAKAADIGPVTRAAVMAAGSLLTFASVVAIFKMLTGLAPDYAAYRNLAITIHVVTVLPAVPLGAYLLLATKGTRMHKTLGKVWIALMVITAVAITFVRGGTDFSWIHIFVPYTIWGAWKVVATARRHDIAAHRKEIVGLYLGALIIPGVWAFLPNRLMGLWLFG